MQHRTAWSDAGGTWGLLGGARNLHESSASAALREAAEESGLDSSTVEVHSVFGDDHGGWSYDTVISSTPQMATLSANEQESQEVRWVKLSEVEQLSLHPGFAETWPSVRAKMERVVFGRGLYEREPSTEHAGVKDASAGDHDQNHGHAEPTIVQRLRSDTADLHGDIVDDWETQSELSTRHPRPEKLQQVDERLAAWRDYGRHLSGRLDLQRHQLEQALSAIDRWSESKQRRSGKRVAAVDRLRQRIETELSDVVAQHATGLPARHDGFPGGRAQAASTVATDGAFRTSGGGAQQGPGTDAVVSASV
jgi:ADP-ribose pyrophosphatase YjhB (NUDIX family)